MPDILVDLSRDELARRALVEPLLPLRSSTKTLLEKVAAARGAVSLALPQSGVGYYPDVLDFDALLSHEDTLLEPYRSFIDSLQARRVALVCLGELIRLGSGDCRAYAIAMEIALKSAGITDTCLAYFTELTPGGVNLGDHMLSLVYYPGDASTEGGVYILDAMPGSSPFWSALPLAPLISLPEERRAAWLDTLPERIARALSVSPRLERSPDEIASWADLLKALGHRRIPCQGMRLRPNIYPIIVCEATTPELQVTYKEGPMSQLDEELREELSDEIHEIWIGWMEFLFGWCNEQPDGSMVIPAQRVEHWRRQMRTRYAELSEGEKDEDRDQVERLRIVVQNYLERPGGRRR